MTITGGWLDWGSRVPGPQNKVYAESNKGLGIACHSMEGWYVGSLGELTNPDRQASWMFSIRVSGELVSHYPVTASCWASGNFKANTELWSVELEGLAGTPANPAQVKTLQRLGKEYAAHTGRPIQRLMPRTLWEHHEVSLWTTPNAGPTSCPSHRYDPYFATLEVEDLTTEETQALISDALAPYTKRIAQLETQVFGAVGVPRDAQHPYANATMYDLEQSGLLVTAKGTVPQHTHPTLAGETGGVTG